MTQEEASKILKKYLSNQNLLKHSFAAQAAMKGIYAYLHERDFDKKQQEIWGLTGLLHDADYEMAKGKPQIHGILLSEKEPELPEDIAYAIKAHNPATGLQPKSDMDWAIRSSDQLTGLIVAATLIHPDKKLASINTEFVLNRFTEKSFAKGADRESIRMCEEQLGIPLPEFVKIVLSSMQKIHEELGL